MTIVASGREHRVELDAEVFSWSEMPELLAAEDLFDHDPSAAAFVGAAVAVIEPVLRAGDAVVVAAKDDEDEDFEDEEIDEEEAFEAEDYEKYGNIGGDGKKRGKTADPNMGDGSVKGVLSVTISNWTTPGL